jgi:hypothetical protein
MRLGVPDYISRMYVQGQGQPARLHLVLGLSGHALRGTALPECGKRCLLVHAFGNNVQRTGGQGLVDVLRIQVEQFIAQLCTGPGCESAHLAR